MSALAQIKDKMPNAVKTSKVYDRYFIKYTKSKFIPQLIFQTAKQ